METNNAATGTAHQDWAPVRRIIHSRRRLRDFERVRVHSLLALSNERFAPLLDPLKIDLGAHRWLKFSREESYSDWLAWVFEQIDSPKDLIALLRIEPDVAGERLVDRPVITREKVLEEGHPGHGGRIDLLIEIGNDVVIGLEVKTCEAEAADTAKQEGYLSCLSQLPAKSRHPILLTVDAAEENYCGFTVLRWRDITLGLRSMIPFLQKSKGISVAAMVAAFVGAVEQNLLGFTADGDIELALYLEQSLKGSR